MWYSCNLLWDAEVSASIASWRQRWHFLISIQYLHCSCTAWDWEDRGMLGYFCCKSSGKCSRGKKKEVIWSILLLGPTGLLSGSSTHWHQSNSWREAGLWRFGAIYNFLASLSHLPTDPSGTALGKGCKKKSHNTNPFELSSSFSLSVCLCGLADKLPLDKCQWDK